MAKNQFLLFDTKRKLFLSSVIISLIITLSVFITLNNYISQLVIQQQKVFNTYAFEIIKKQLKSIHEEVEIYYKKIDNNKIINELLKYNFDKTDIIEINKSIKTIDTELNNIFIKKDYIESVLLIGRNNISYGGFEGSITKFFGENLNFEILYKVINRELELNTKEGIPIYVHIEDKSAVLSSAENEILKNMQDHIVVFRTLRDVHGTKGIIITILNTNFLSSNFKNTDRTQNNILTDRNGNIIWEKTVTYIDPDAIVLKTTNIIEPYGFSLINTIEKKNILKNSIYTKKYIVFWGLFCTLYVLIVSHFYSLRITNPLRKMVKNISNEHWISTDNRNSKKTTTKGSLSNSLLRYFLLSTMIPNLLFVTFSINRYYKYYKDEVTLFSRESMYMIRQNIDYSLETYNILLQQIVFNRGVQEILSDYSNDYRITTDQIFIDNLLRNFQGSKYRSQFNIHLYNSKGENIYSTLNYDMEKNTLSDKYLFDLINKSSGELIFTGIKKNYYLEPELTFVRKINDIFTSDNYPIIGYAKIGISPDFITGISSFSEDNFSGSFVVLDKYNNIVSSPGSTANKFLPYLSEKSLDKEVFTIQHNNQSFTVISDSSRLFSIKYFRVIPNAMIKSRLTPFYRYSLLIFLSAIFLVISISYIVSRSILFPLNKLLKEMEDAVVDKKADYMLPTKGQNEISFISMKFNIMLKKMDQLIHDNYISKIHEKELMLLQKEAQLDTLQQQINPHFLYNTLESINWMAYKAGTHDICKMVSALGRFLREALKNDDIITIEDEIKNLKDYIFIQELRYSGRLKIEWNIDSAIYKYKTVKLILQPLVENAISHGIDSMRDGGEILISGRKFKKIIILSIEDNGVGMDAEFLENLLLKLDIQEKSKTNIGIKNVYLRLKLFYGSDFKIKLISKKGSGTIVTLSFPVK